MPVLLQDLRNVHVAILALVSFDKTAVRWSSFRKLLLLIIGMLRAQTSVLMVILRCHILAVSLLLVFKSLLPRLHLATFSFVFPEEM